VKILMTGMAARGVGSTRTKHKIASLPDVIAAALRELGHEVDGPRRVEGRGDVRADAILVQVGWSSSLSSTYAHEAGALMGAAASVGVPLLRYVDDWRSQWLADDVAGHVVSDRGWRNHTEKFRRDVYRELKPYTRDLVREGLAATLDAPVLVPTMGWGDPQKFDSSAKARLSRVVGWDPQRLVPYDVPEWPEDFRRARRWVVASLQEHDRWVSDQHLTWPVVRMGANPKLPGGVPVAGATNRVRPEGEVLQAYADAWGVLSPAYASAGSGYWRTRWFQAMLSGAILWPGSADSEAIGGAFSGMDPADVEVMRESDLQELAAAQSDRIWETSWTREEALGELDAIVGDIGGYAPFWPVIGDG